MTVSRVFGYQVCYGLRDAVDGTSSTIAFCESTVGPATATPGQKDIGLPSVSIPSSALLADASSNLTATQQGIAACNAAQHAAGTWTTANRGAFWAYGGLGMTMFNTVALPNSIAGWTYCGNLGTTVLLVYSEADSMHSGGVNTLMGDGSVRFIKNSINQQTWMALGTKAGNEVVSQDQY